MRKTAGQRKMRGGRVKDEGEGRRERKTRERKVRERAGRQTGGWEVK